jgi:hypothetical protein
MPTILRKKFIDLNVQQINLKYVDVSSITIDGYEGGNTNYPVSIDTTPKNFSFKNNLADNEFVQNPNILEEKDYSRIKNVPLDMVNKFDNQDDPFFDFDEQRPVFETSRFGPNLIKKDTIRKVARKMSSTSIARSPKSKTYGVK